MGVIYLQNRAENDENLPSSKKNKSPKKGGKKGKRWIDPSQGEKKKPPMMAGCKGNMNKSSTQTPSLKEHISQRERRNT
jgi:hypothetical protein